MHSIWADNTDDPSDKDRLFFVMATWGYTDRLTINRRTVSLKKSAHRKSQNSITQKVRPEGRSGEVTTVVGVAVPVQAYLEARTLVRLTGHRVADRLSPGQEAPGLSRWLRAVPVAVPLVAGVGRQGDVGAAGI